MLFGQSASIDSCGRAVCSLSGAISERGAPDIRIRTFASKVDCNNWMEREERDLWLRNSVAEIREMDASVGNGR